MGCIYKNGSGQVVFKQDAFLLNHGLFQRISPDAIQVTRQGWTGSDDAVAGSEIWQTPWIASSLPELGYLSQVLYRCLQQGMWQRSISCIFWICTFNKKSKYSSWITNFKNLPIQLAQGAASEGGTDLGSKGSWEVNRCGKWIVNATSRFDIIYIAISTVCFSKCLR